MILSTSTNILFLLRDGSIFPMERSMTFLRNAGFENLDINFQDWTREKESPYRNGDWERWIHGVAQKAEQLGVRFGQTHASFYDFADPRLSPEERERNEALTRRSILCSQIVGAKVTVLHPQTVYGTATPYRSSKKANLEYYRRLLDATAKLNIRIAIETAWDLDVAPRKKYCTNAEELGDLIDTIHDPRIGACWDIEHGDIMKQDQPAQLRYLGKRVIATHVSEQFGCNENFLMHRLPFFGRIQWEPIVRALQEIGYDGCFSFEVHNYLNTMPQQLFEPALKLAYEAGAYLMSL